MHTVEKMLETGRGDVGQWARQVEPIAVARLARCVGMERKASGEESADRLPAARVVGLTG